MKSLRQAAPFLFGVLLLSVATPSCGADDRVAGERPAAGRGGTGGAAGGEAGHTNGRAGTGSSSRGGSPSTLGAAGMDGGAGAHGTTLDAGAGGDEQATSGGTGNAVGQAGEGASPGEGGKTTNGGHSGTGTAGSGGNSGSPSCKAMILFGDLSVDDSSAPTDIGFAAAVLPNLGSSARSDLIRLDLLRDKGGGEVGPFELGTGIDDEIDTCARCLMVSEDLGNKFYFATAGDLTFDSDSLQVDGYPQGTLRDITLREISLDSLGHGTFVPGGDCLTVADADLLVNVPLPPPPPPGWTCQRTWYGDGECDCGCGALDVDCASSSSAACDNCFCDGDYTFCSDSAVNATENYLCDVRTCTEISLGELSVDANYAPSYVDFSAPLLPNLGSSLSDTIQFKVTSQAVGTFELGTGVDASLDTCVRCLTVLEDYGARRYLATEGTLTYDPSSRQLEGYPQGTLRNVTLREITRGGSNGDITIVPGGRCLTLADADLLVNVPGSPPPPVDWVNCPANRYGDGTCDCGCGALDSDCASSDVSDCEDCNCGNDDCSLVNATENYLCDDVWFPPCTAISSLDNLGVDISNAPTSVLFNARVHPNLGATLDDWVVFEVYGSEEVGTFELGTGLDENYETCVRCLSVFQDNYGKRYFATEGTLTFDPDSRQMEGSPHGTLRNVTLRQVYLDPRFHSTIVPGGSCLTIADADPLVNRSPLAPIPPGWVNCPESYYRDSDCDCGCGALDPSCASSSATECDYCFCDGDNGTCLGSTVKATENYLCE